MRTHEQEKLAEALNRSRMNEPKFEDEYTTPLLEALKGENVGRLFRVPKDGAIRRPKGERGFFLLPFLFGIGLWAVATSEPRRKVVVVEKHVAGCRCEVCGGAK